MLALRNGKRFQSYQFRQINPDTVNGTNVHIQTRRVSIVSIQADQSRRIGRRCQILGIGMDSFNRINSGRSIPTNGDKGITTYSVLFQSYQFRQINPDSIMKLTQILFVKLFQSYQFRQINPDSASTASSGCTAKGVSIVSIQADQSRRMDRMVR